MQDELLKLQLEFDYESNRISYYKKNFKYGVPEEILNDIKEKYNTAMEEFIKLGRIVMGNSTANSDEIKKWIVEHAAQQIKEFLKLDCSVMEQNLIRLDKISRQYLCLMEACSLKNSLEPESKEFLNMFTPEEIEKYKEFEEYLKNPYKKII